MKLLFFLLALLTTLSVSAGYYGNTLIDIYDPSSGLYYKAITEKQKSRGFISKSSNIQVVNIAIYNPETNNHAMLFKPSKARNIHFVMFETGFDKGVISFNKDRYHPNLKNNITVEKREPHDQLLIGIRDEEKKLTELWFAKKDGKGLKKITNVPFKSSWHIDVKNSKLRVVTSTNGVFKIDSFDW